MRTILITAAIAFGLSSMKTEAVSQKDRDFAEEAALSGVKEVQLGQLAQSNAYSVAVRELGQKMVADHTKANDRLKELAAKKGIVLPISMSLDDKEKYDKLSKMNGKEFDKAFVHCMKKDHKKALCMYKKEAKKGDDADFQNFALATKPTLEQHLDLTKEACKEVKKNK